VLPVTKGANRAVSSYRKLAISLTRILGRFAPCTARSAACDDMADLVNEPKVTVMSTYNMQANGVNDTEAATVLNALPNFENTSEVVFVVSATGGGADLGPGVGQNPPPPTPAAIWGYSGSAPGVIGNSVSGPGVTGASQFQGVSGSGPVGVYGNGNGGPMAGAGVVGQGTSGSPGMVGMAYEANDFNLSNAAGVLGASAGDSTRDPNNPGAVRGAGVVGLSIASLGGGSDFPGSPLLLPDPNAVPDGNGTGVWGASGGGTGVYGQSQSGTGVSGQSENGCGGIFESASAAQLRLIPSAIPLEDNETLMQSGHTGDLYLYSVAEEVGTTGTYHYSTILWLCIAPAPAGGQAMWAQVSLGDTVGG
jgi:hypothetical protein